MIASTLLPNNALVSFLLPTFIIVLQFHLTACLDETRTTSFVKLSLCADTFPGTASVRARSKVTCAALCVAESSCTACTYISKGTCNLHQGDVTSKTCSTSRTLSAIHLRKKTDTTLTTTTATVTTETTIVPATTTTTTTASGIQCQNGGDAINGNTACRCYKGYIGDFCERLMRDCSEGLSSGHYPDMRGIYQVLPEGASSAIQVMCDKSVHSIVLRHWNNDLKFNVTLAEYVSGFGGNRADYWIGLENLHLITSNNPFTYVLGVQLSNFSNQPFYQHYYIGFKVKGAADGYAMTFAKHQRPGPPATPMGDCLTPLQNKPFSAYDADNDNNENRNCAVDYASGWWFNENCSECNLMGQLRWNSQTRIPGAVNEVFWLPGLDPPDFSPYDSNMFLLRGN